jgi:hypothetical protein
MKVIAISGWKGSGKDLSAEYLVENHGFKRVSFADPLKDSVALEYGITREWLDDPKMKERPIFHMPVESKDEFTKMIHNFMVREFRTSGWYKPDVSNIRIENGRFETFLFDRWDQLFWTPRALAILKGSTNRSIQSNFWVEKAIENITFNPKLNYVISDLRYRSEVEQLKEAFGNNLVTVRLERFDVNPSTDPSETDLDRNKFDYIIKNKGEKEAVFAWLKEIVSKL